MFFSQIHQAPGPDFRKVGKSLILRSYIILSVAGDPFKSEGFTSDPFASEDPFKDAFGTSSSSTNKVSRGEG